MTLNAKVPRIDQIKLSRVVMPSPTPTQIPLQLRGYYFSRATDHGRQWSLRGSHILSRPPLENTHVPVPRLISFLLTMKAPVPEGPTHTASVLGLGKGFQAVEKELGMDEVKVRDHKES